jgi:hypothetical protein
MRSLLISIILLTFSNSISSQAIKTDTTLTKRQNAVWVEGFEKLTLESDQIASIKSKIEKDSVFYISNTAVHNWGFKKIERKSLGSGKKISKSNCECKIMFKLIVRSNEYILDYPEFENTPKILDLLNESIIDKITVFKNDVARTVFGERGKCGVIILFSNNGKLKRKIKKLVNSIK